MIAVVAPHRALASRSAAALRAGLRLAGPGDDDDDDQTPIGDPPDDDDAGDEDDEDEDEDEDDEEEPLQAAQAILRRNIAMNSTSRHNAQPSEVRRDRRCAKRFVGARPDPDP